MKKMIFKKSTKKMIFKRKSTPQIKMKKTPSVPFTKARYIA